MQPSKFQTVDSSFIDDFLDEIIDENTGSNNTEPEPKPVEPIEKTEPKPENNLLKGPETLDFNFTDLVETDEEEVQTPLSKTPKSQTPIKTNESSLDFNKLIDEGVLSGFDDEDFKISSLDDVKELIIANKEQWQREILEEKGEEYFEDLPEELSYAVSYAKNGGSDFKSLFRMLAEDQDIKSLDPEKHSHEVVRTYLAMTNFGTAEEIEEQVYEWEDNELLLKKAKAFKPKLDAVVKEREEAVLLEQAEATKKQQEFVQKYYVGIDEALKEKNINGISLSKDEAKEVKKALTDSIYTSSRTGKPLNLLAKFLEEITYDKPNYALLSELALFAKDPEAYRNKIKELGKEASVTELSKKLKTNQGNIKAPINTTPEPSESKKKVIPRSAGLLSRLK